MSTGWGGGNVGCVGPQYRGWCGMPKSRGLRPILGAPLGSLHPSLSPLLSRVGEFPGVCELIS